MSAKKTLTLDVWSDLEFIVRLNLRYCLVITLDRAIHCIEIIANQFLTFFFFITVYEVHSDPALHSNQLN